MEESGRDSDLSPVHSKAGRRGQRKTGGWETKVETDSKDKERRERNAELERNSGLSSKLEEAR